MAGRLAFQATGAFDAAMNGGQGISMCVLESAPTANPRIGISRGGNARAMRKASTNTQQGREIIGKSS